MDSTEDVDLRYMIEETRPPYSLADIAVVLANGMSKEGAPGDLGEGDYVWALRLGDGRAALTVAWHDFSGWGCQDGSYTALFRDVDEMKDFIQHWPAERVTDVLGQLRHGRKPAWYEQKNAELGVKK
jgi:hypothetical protein